jgi:hypothetical protein
MKEDEIKRACVMEKEEMKGAAHRILVGKPGRKRLHGKIKA